MRRDHYAFITAETMLSLPFGLPCIYQTTVQAFFISLRRSATSVSTSSIHFPHFPSSASQTPTFHSHTSPPLAEQPFLPLHPVRFSFPTAHSLSARQLRETPPPSSTALAQRVLVGHSE